MNTSSKKRPRITLRDYCDRTNLICTAHDLAREHFGDYKYTITIHASAGKGLRAHVLGAHAHVVVPNRPWRSHDHH